MKTFERMLVWLLVATQVLWAMPVQAVGAPAPAEAAKPGVTVADVVEPAAPAPAPAPKAVRVNRTAPAVKPVPQVPVFSALPTVEEIFRAHVFEEPLHPGAWHPDPAREPRPGGKWCRWAICTEDPATTSCRY